MSKIIARIPTSQPEEIQALVAPGFPSPTSLASLPEIYLLNISDHGTDPLKKPTKVHIKKSIVGTLQAHLHQWFTRGRVPYQSWSVFSLRIAVTEIFVGVISYQIKLNQRNQYDPI